MLLSGDDGAGLGGSLENDVLVNGLDGGHIDHPHGDTLRLEGLGGDDRLVDQQAGGDDRHVGAGHHLLALADGELHALLVEYRHRQAAQAQIHRALILGGGPHRGGGLGAVGGVEDHHTGDGAHNADILTALVGGAVLAHRDTGVGGGDLDVQLGVGHRVADLLEGASGGKHRKGGGKHSLAGGGQACGDADHIALGDTGVEEPVGMGYFKHTRLGGGGQVGVHHDDVLPLVAQLHQGGAVGVAGGYSLHFCHRFSPPIPAGWRSAPPSPHRTALCWGQCRAKRTDSP